MADEDTVETTGSTSNARSAEEEELTNEDTVVVVEPVEGTAGSDIIVGSEEADVISANAGVDIVMGEGGDDFIDGGAGSDILLGGSGDDTIEGGAGGDLILGGSGDDILRGDGGRDIIRGGSGDDTIEGGEGNDYLFGESGDDTIEGGAGNDYLFGGSGNDTIEGGAGADLITGGSGDDTLTGGAGGDVFVFDPKSGNDTITDFDTAEDHINLSAFRSDDSIESKGESIESKGEGIGAKERAEGRGISYDDLTIEATADGTGTVITITGTERQTDPVTITLEGVTVTDVTADMFEFNRSPPVVAVHTWGTEEAMEYPGGPGAATYVGGEGDDDLSGAGGHDWLLGNEGDDTLRGGAGDDVIYGGEGDDTIDGGAGTNFVHGGAGADNFVVRQGQTQTTIADFTDGEDQIDFSNISGITGFDDLTITDYDGTAVIDLSAHGAGTVRLESVAVADLDASDFLFAEPAPVESM